MSASDADSLHSKVAAVTLGFWVMKIAATTLGETAGDLLSMTLNLGYVASSAILLTIFAGLLALQLSARRFHPVLFWSVVLATSTAGTTMSDLLDAGVEILVLGQYLQPTRDHAEVVEYVHPNRFEALAEVGRSMGFAYVAAGPLVRTSYRAAEAFVHHRTSVATE